MTQEDQDAVVGRVTREYHEAVRKVAALHAEAKRIGRDLEIIAQALGSAPWQVVFESPTLPAATGSRVVIKAELFDAERLRTLLTGYQKWTAERDDLGRQLRALGYPPVSGE